MPRPRSNSSEPSDDWGAARPEGKSVEAAVRDPDREFPSDRTSTLALADLLALVDTALRTANRMPGAEHDTAEYLEEIQEQLTCWHARQLALGVEVERLRRTLEESAALAATERQFLIQQQDQFLGSLLDDHERGVEALRAECERAWRKVSELQADARSGNPPTNPSERRLANPHEVSREVLLRAKQQRDEAQRQTVEALSRLDSAMSELEQLRSLVAPSTLPPGPEIPISMPPLEPLRPALVPDVARIPSAQPTGWRRSVPPVRRDSSSFTRALGSEVDEPPGAHEGRMSASASDVPPVEQSLRPGRSDLPSIATAAALGDSLESLHEATSGDATSGAGTNDEPATPARRELGPPRETVGGYSITLDGSNPAAGRSGNAR